MSRPIDADKLWKAFTSADKDDIFGIEDIEQIVDDAPTIEAVSVVHGEWKWISSTYDRTPCRKTYMCSCCRHEVITFDVEPWEHYCPQCGAKMDGERKGEWIDE